MSLLQVVMDQTRTHEISNISVMSEADIADDLPNGDESAFPSSDGHQPVAVSVNGVNALQNVAATHVQGVFVTATPHTLLTPEQLHEAGIKTTHIVIHDQTNLTTLSDNGLKTPQTPLSPSPETPLISGNSKFKYNWDESVHDPVLPVRCKNTSGEMHKDKFGSGGRGRCIRVGNDWYTPSEFEAKCGRASSKDWKRSIRYGGRTLQCLIEEGILQPHATSCTCSACCDDITVTGPVRLFVPYKRRKRENESGVPGLKKIQHEDPIKEMPANQLKDSVVVLTPSCTGITAPALTISTPSNSSDNLPAIISEGSVVTTTNTSSASSPAVAPCVNSSPKVPSLMEFTEQKQWWQLEEMVNNLINYGQQVKHLVEQVKTQSLTAKENALQQLRIHLEKEKNDAVNAARIESQVMFQRALLEDRTDKELRIQTRGNADKTDIKRCANCNREAFSECMECRTVSYCSNFCQQKDWSSHQQECSANNIVLVREVDISEEEKD